MNTHSDLSFSTTANVLSSGLSLDAIRQRAPAVFAHSPDERMSDKYTFIPTERVLSGLMQAGFVPVEARQSRARRSSALHARHVVRLRRRFETVQLKDAVPEVVFLNSHDGSAAALQGRADPLRGACAAVAVPGPGRSWSAAVATADLPSDRGPGRRSVEHPEQGAGEPAPRRAHASVGYRRLTRTRRITAIREDVRPWHATASRTLNAIRRIPERTLPASNMRLWLRRRPSRWLNSPSG